MKNLDKFVLNKKSIPWVNLVWEKHYRNGRPPGTIKKGSFWWRDTLKTLLNFKKMANMQVVSGHSCFFQKDKWSSQILEEQFPQAFSFAKNKLASVEKASKEENVTNLFALPLSEVAFDQVLSIQ